MKSLLVTAALVLGFVAGCAHVEAPASTPPEKTLLSDSRIPKSGSPQSRGVVVIPVSRLHQQGTATLARGLKKASPIIR